MRIFVTGSNGYVGNNFIKNYNNKYKFETFSLINQMLENIIFNNIDIVLHCAALVHQKKEQNYTKYYEINVEYPLRLAKFAKENGVKQFVFMSTIAVYGENSIKINELISCQPKTSYGKSKREAEKRLLELNDESFTVSIIRAPMVYGKNAPGNIKTLINLVDKVSILPFGGIENKRNFIYIGNLCHLLNEVIKQKQSGIFLASDDKPLSTSKLIELIAINLNKNLFLLKIPFFEDLVKSLKPTFHKKLYGSLEVDNSITKNKLNLVNPYSVEDGIEYMVNKEMK